MFKQYRVPTGLHSSQNEVGFIIRFVHANLAVCMDVNGSP